jgi:hypothetical protein
MEYRRADAGDVPALAEMNARLIRDEGHRNPMTVAELTTRLAGWLAGEYEAVLFEEAGAAIGKCCFSASRSTFICGSSTSRPSGVGGVSGATRSAGCGATFGKTTESAWACWSATPQARLSGGPSDTRTTA